jgi:hypothetical protein
MSQKGAAGLRGAPIGTTDEASLQGRPAEPQLQPRTP